MNGFVGSLYLLSQSVLESARISIWQFEFAP